VGAAVLIVALALAAGWRVGTTPPEDGAASAPDQPVQGGVLRVAVERPKHLDPALAGPVPVSDAVVADLLFDGLTAPGDEPGNARPALAESWRPSDDRRSWQFFLRPGARFADGDEITASDVVGTLNRIAKKGSNSPVSRQLGPVQGYRAVAVDGTTDELAGVSAPRTDVVRIDLDEPVGALPAILSAPAFGIVPGATGPVGEDSMFDKAPPGSGPFALADGEELGDRECECDRHRDAEPDRHSPGLADRRDHHGHADAGDDQQAELDLDRADRVEEAHGPSLRALSSA
jgi:ABC-type transport system substrate-binding protein